MLSVFCVQLLLPPPDNLVMMVFLFPFLPQGNWAQRRCYVSQLQAASIRPALLRKALIEVEFCIGTLLQVYKIFLGDETIASVK